jgi:hypothetical protein
VTIDLAKLTVQELKNLLANQQRLERPTKATVVELARRGAATGSDYVTLRWNQASVCDALRPFKEIAAAVAGNRRTAYTEAGGGRIGRPKNDPERVWIDSYSAIKTPVINAVFVCYIRRPGDDPEFQLYLNRVYVRSYNADQLTDALGEWRAVAARAAS